MSDESSVLPKGLTQQGKLWTSYIARNVKTQEADNPDAIFITGRTVLDKEAFNKINDGEHDVVHGVQVFYGPFATKAAAMEFISEYKCDWPGDNEWRWIKPGKPEIISSFYEPGKADLVHNASLEFQGQVAYQEMQRRIAEVEEVQRRLEQREKEENLKNKPLTEKEKNLHIQWQEQKISQAEKQLEQMKKHLDYLKRLPSVKDN